MPALGAGCKAEVARRSISRRAVPNMSDGALAIAESGAILRYIANKYGPEMYGGQNFEKKAVIDWALEWASTNFSKNFSNIWYPTTGFGPPPDDQTAANASALENLENFVKVFLPTGKFIGGADEPSIADYVCAVRFHMCSHAAVKAKTGFELPARLKIYVQDFKLACPHFDFLGTHDGFLSTKM